GDLRTAIQNDRSHHSGGRRLGPFKRIQIDGRLHPNLPRCANIISSPPSFTADTLPAAGTSLRLHFLALPVKIPKIQTFESVLWNKGARLMIRLPRRSLFSFAPALALAFATSLASAQTLADADLVNALRGGGYVIVFRHGATHPDQADTDPLNVDKP